MYYPTYRYTQALVDDSMSYQHPTSFQGLWVIYGLLRTLTRFCAVTKVIDNLLLGRT